MKDQNPIIIRLYDIILITTHNYTRPTVVKFQDVVGYWLNGEEEREKILDRFLV